MVVLKSPGELRKLQDSGELHVDEVKQVGQRASQSKGGPCDWATEIVVISLGVLFRELAQFIRSVKERFTEVLVGVDLIGKPTDISHPAENCFTVFQHVEYTMLFKPLFGEGLVEGPVIGQR
jgi:hypothetical protein